MAFAQSGQEVEDVQADGDVEHGDGFVGQQDAGADGEGAGDDDALALAAGQLVREFGQDVGAEVDLLEQVGGRCFDVGAAAQAAVQAQGAADGVADGAQVVE